MAAGPLCFGLLRRLGSAECVVFVPDASGLPGPYRGRPGYYVYDCSEEAAFALENLVGISDDTVLFASLMP